MPQYAQSTTVSKDRSLAEIERILTRYGHHIRFHPYGCWEWIGTIDTKGYGVASVSKSKNVRAHRLIYEAFRGPISDGLDLDHLCRNRSCVNPHHLEPVTRKENVYRGESITIRAHLAGTCIRGHAMTPENTYISPKGQRHCQTCRRMREHKRDLKRKAAQQ
jgi:hypothetical protein